MEYLVVDVDNRKINIPESITHLGVKDDNETRTLNFRMPKIYKGLDMSDYTIEINYINAKGKADSALAGNIQVGDEEITFQWCAGGTVYAKDGKVRFLVYTYLENEDLTKTNEWHTTWAALEVLDGGNVEEQIAEENPRIIEEMLRRIRELENGETGGTKDAIQYIEQELTDEQKAQARVNIGAVSEDEVSTKVKQAISEQSHFRFEKVEAIPDAGEGNVIYLVPSAQEESNIYEEYLFVDGVPELIGSTQIDLSGYAPKATTLAGYGITDGATKEEVGQIREQVADYIGEEIPDYWKEFIDGKESVIKEKLDEGGVDAFPILWGADIHGSNGASNTNGAGTSVTKNIGLVAKYTLDKYKAPYVLFSGDIHSQASHTTEESVHAEYEAVNAILSVIGEDELLVEKGNHDGAWGAPVDGVYYLKNIGGKKIYNRLFRRQSLDRNRVFGGDGSYFYVDSPQNVRIIMLNGHTDGDGSVDADGNAVYNSMKNGVYGTEQLKWLCEVALNVSEGTRIIVSAHQPFSTSSDGTLLAGILEAYNKRIAYTGTKNVQGDYWGKDVADTTYTNVSVSADFSEAKGKVVIYLHGHIHKDTIDTATYSFAVASITTAGADVRDTDPPLRTPDTATETALDFVIMSKTAINFIRIGAGSDRVIALDDTVYYSVKNNLTNVKNSNSAGNIVAGNSYSATISANTGYELDSVVVTMGGVDVTSSVYADGVITITEVTGNVVITASATKIDTGEDEPTTGYTNLFDTSGSGYEVVEGSSYDELYSNWIPYNQADNGSNGTIYHLKGATPYKFRFATDNNGTNATELNYVTNANVQGGITADYDSNVVLIQHNTNSQSYKYVQFYFRSNKSYPDDSFIITANENIVEDSTTNYTNLFDASGVLLNQRINSSMNLTSGDGHMLTNDIANTSKTAVIRIKGLTSATQLTDGKIRFNDADGVAVALSDTNYITLDTSNVDCMMITLKDTIPWAITSFRIHIAYKVGTALTTADIPDLIITVDEEIS